MQHERLSVTPEGKNMGKCSLVWPRPEFLPTCPWPGLSWLENLYEGKINIKMEILVGYIRAFISRFCCIWLRWSSGLLIHGTIVDGSRAALLLPLAMSVIQCQPVTRCSIIDTAFLLLATVSSLNLLTVALSDAPLLPPPVLVPTLLQSAGFTRSHTQQHYASPLYAKGEPTSYYSVWKWIHPFFLTDF